MNKKELYIGEMIVRMLQCERELSIRQILAFTQHLLADSNGEVAPVDVNLELLRQVTQAADNMLKIDDAEHRECAMVFLETFKKKRLRKREEFRWRI